MTYGSTRPHPVALRCQKRPPTGPWGGATTGAAPGDTVGTVSVAIRSLLATTIQSGGRCGLYAQYSAHPCAHAPPLVQGLVERRHLYPRLTAPPRRAGPLRAGALHHAVPVPYGPAFPTILSILLAASFTAASGLLLWFTTADSHASEMAVNICTKFGVSSSPATCGSCFANCVSCGYFRKMGLKCVGSSTICLRYGNSKVASRNAASCWGVMYHLMNCQASLGCLVLPKIVKFFGSLYV